MHMAVLWGKLWAELSPGKQSWGNTEGYVEVNGWSISNKDLVNLDLLKLIEFLDLLKIAEICIYWFSRIVMNCSEHWLPRKRRTKPWGMRITVFLEGVLFSKSKLRLLFPTTLAFYDLGLHPEYSSSWEMDIKAARWRGLWFVLTPLAICTC